jgi:hypothetical protein
LRGKAHEKKESNASHVLVPDLSIPSPIDPPTTHCLARSDLTAGSHAPCSPTAAAPSRAPTGPPGKLPPARPYKLLSPRPDERPPPRPYELPRARLCELPPLRPCELSLTRPCELPPRAPAGADVSPSPHEGGRPPWPRSFLSPAQDCLGPLLPRINSKCLPRTAVSFEYEQSLAWTLNCFGV